MIRPFTLVCMISAFGAGLYLYQSKHQAQVLDRQIMRTMKQTEATRERSGMLRAEWALLNEPDRLAELAKAHLSLQTLKPTQFVAANDLASRLPAPVANAPEKLPVEAEPTPVPVAQATIPTPVAVPVAAAKPREVAAVEPKPKPEPKQEARQETKPETKPVAVAEAKPAPHRAEKPIVRAEAEPVVVAAPVRRSAPVSAPVVAEAANNDATAPGTVGAAVMRAMRAQNSGFVQVAPVAAPSRAPAPAYAQPAYAQPAYTPAPAYVQPAYAGASSMLGGRNSLPPPVPFAAR